MDSFPLDYPVQSIAYVRIGARQIVRVLLYFVKSILALFPTRVGEVSRLFQPFFYPGGATYLRRVGWGRLPFRSRERAERGEAEVAPNVLFTIFVVLYPIVAGIER